MGYFVRKAGVGFRGCRPRPSVVTPSSTPAQVFRYGSLQSRFAEGWYGSFPWGTVWSVRFALRGVTGMAAPRPALYRFAAVWYNPRMGMDLDLDIGAIGRSGRKAKPLSIGEPRPLRSSDLALMSVEQGTKAPAVKRISERHHRLARLLADGVAPAEASLVTGYCLSRISILQADPTFQELLRHYERIQTDAYADLHQRLAGLSVDAADLLQDRMESDPEGITVNQLQSIIQLGADRTGYGPQQTNVSFTGNIADRMDAARRRAKEKRMKDVTPEGEAEAHRVNDQSKVSVFDRGTSSNMPIEEGEDGRSQEAGRSEAAGGPRDGGSVGSGTG